MKKLLCKKYLAILLLAMIIGMIPTAVMAQPDEDGVAPCLTYIVDSECTFSIRNNVATVDCWVEGHYADATKAKVIAELQLESGTNNWIAYATWVETANDYEAYVYETKSVKAGQNYRVKVTATVWEGAQSETITYFSNEITA